VKIKARFLPLVVFAAILVSLVFIIPVFSAVTVNENEVEWTDVSGNDITHVNASTTAYFYIKDDALETIKTGSAAFLGHGATSKFFDVVQAEAGVDSSTATSTGLTVTITSDSTNGYSTSTPASTPWTGSPTVTVGSSSLTVAGSDLSAGTVTVLAQATVATTTVAFTYHIADSWAGGASATRRAKVTSTSDAAGEYVTISEVASIGSSTSDPDSQIFLGSITLSSNAATQGANSDGVWVQDGDTLTVMYLKSDGTTLDTDIITVDSVKPTIAAVTPADDTITGTKNPSITFEVTDAGSGVGDNPGSVISIVITSGGATTTISSLTPAYQPIANGYRVIQTQNASWLATVATGGYAASDSVAFTWTMTATDKAGNTQTKTVDLTIDLTKPTVLTGVANTVTGIGWDADLAVETANSNTSVKVTLSEEIDAATVEAADFTVAGLAPTAAIVGTTTGLKDSVYLTVAAQAVDDKPAVVVVGTIQDKAGNSVDTSSSVTTKEATAADGLKPSTTNTISLGLAVATDKVKITALATEKLAVDGLVVSITGPTGGTANGLLSTTAPTNPLEQEGEITVAAGGTGIYGVTISATDLGSNVADNLTTVTAEAVAASNITISGLNATIKVAKGPIADSDYDGVVDGADITSVSIGGATSSTITVDASARTITLTLAVAATDTDTALVTYKYVKDDVFEIDNSKPTATFDPANAASIENSRPFINVTWDEDEYPGDTHTTVTLTKATIKDPAGVTTDILASFSTTDSKKFIYLPPDALALGDYTLTVSAKDDAGNEQKDQTATFTIKAKALTSITLRPGWNLISIPGTPVDSDINAVITVASVDTVLTYDPTVPGNWLTAVRTSAGILEGPLMTIDASHAYWVHTDTFNPIKVAISGLAGGAQKLPPELDLVAGWNLVPAVSLDAAFTSADPDEYFTGLDWTRAYRYSTEFSRFETFTKTTNAVDDIKVGEGYWLFLKTAGVLVP